MDEKKRVIITPDNSLMLRDERGQWWRVPNSNDDPRENIGPMPLEAAIAYVRLKG